jgi:hypothetical protein
MIVSRGGPSCFTLGLEHVICEGGLMSGLDPKVPKQLTERSARAVLRWVVGFVQQIVQLVIQQLVQSPLVGWVVAAIVGGGSGAGATQVESGPLRWIFVAVAVGVVVVCVVVVWRSQTRRQITVLRGQLEAAQTKAKADEDVKRLLAGQVEVREQELVCERERIELARRARAYHANETQVLEGLGVVLDNRELLNVPLDQLIEENSLRPTAEVIALMLGGGGDLPRVELGIAEKTPGGFRVTHGSGPYTLALKRPEGCFCGNMEISTVLARKAEVGFGDGAFSYIPLQIGSTEQFLFALSTVTLGEPEKDTLDKHANIVKLTISSLGPTMT